METGGMFWRDLAEDLKDPVFLRAYVVESVRIAAIDRVVNELDELREEAGLSKAALARAIGAQPSVVRRLFSSPEASPTLATLAEVAAALGMRVALEPMSDAEAQSVMQPLRDGVALDTRSVVRWATGARVRRRAAKTASA